HVEFHPTADNLLMTTNASHSIQIHDLAVTDGSERPAIMLDLHAHTIHCAHFNGDGTLLCTTCRDGRIRVIDPRLGAVVGEGAGHGGNKAQMATWCFGEGRQEVLATTGNATAGQRQLCLWD
ncbi:unnamed protein product, partial [Discosporangium mesarthrocarpum]